MSDATKIVYTHTDEAPALATYSLLPIIRAFTKSAGVTVETRDISLAGRILAAFPDRLREDQRQADHLAELGALTQSPDANIIKLPNISASTPQMIAAIAELQAKGFDVPHYPEHPASDQEREIRRRYDRVKGSAVNPILREGNSDRRAPAAVKAYAQRHPHSMGAWPSDSRTHVATMTSDDFRSNEQSVVVSAPTSVRIQHVGVDGTTTVLKDDLQLLAGEIVDATFMSKRSLVAFLDTEIADARKRGVLFSLHMKATMMKVSDPIIFGHAVRVYYKDLFLKHGSLFDELGVNVTHGFADVLQRIADLPEEQRRGIESDIQAIYDHGPPLAMVDSDRGITNLHLPNDIIIDASMPAMIRSSGQMWNPAGELQDTKAVIPDSCYAGVYQEVIRSCQEHGAFDPATMGSVPNVGLMAQKAEEYGSHDKTYEIRAPGTVQVVDADGTVLAQHQVATGDVWRMCQTKPEPIQDWIKLAVRRARSTSTPAVFWLDEARPHDARLIDIVRRELPRHDTDGLEFHIMPPAEACRFSLQRLREGKDTISVTGNVLRDYLTDLFPILELGTSAKMLSIVPLMKGGGLFETGAGGSAPKHVQQLVREGHLRWDSLGEFLALAESLELFAERHQVDAAQVLAEALRQATADYLEERRSPSRKVQELDNRGSHYYLALYWARALAAQAESPELRATFAPVAEALARDEAAIIDELNAAQGAPVDLGGYFRPPASQLDAVMRPSPTLNRIIDGI
jgi:isocitrate dehydrogenase